MNKRFEELVKKHGVDITIDSMGYGEGNIEGLAELIVRECAKAAGDFEYARLHDSLVEEHILKHFGVEE